MWKFFNIFKLENPLSMKNITLLVFLLFINIGLFGQNSVSPSAIEFIIQLNNEVDIDKFLSQFNNSKQGITFEKKRTIISRENLHLISTKADQASEVTLDLLKGNRFIKKAFLNQSVENRVLEPNDPSFFSQWSMPMIELPNLWEITTGGMTIQGDEIVIAVVEKDGADLTHSDLIHNLWINKGEIPNDNIDNDNNGYVDDIHGFNMKNQTGIYSGANHGTSVLGVLGAKGNNEKFIAGVNWDVKIMLLEAKGFDEISESYEYIYQQRKLYRETNGEKGAFVVVVNSSFGTAGWCDELTDWNDRYSDLGKEGVLSVGSAPNDPFNVDIRGDLPASCGSEHLITVSMTDSNDEYFRSGTGIESIDLSAPGKDVPVLFSGERLGEDLGTSISAPHVSGVIALLYSLPCDNLISNLKAQPENTALLMKDFILNGTDPIPSLLGKSKTGGRLNARHSMDLINDWCFNGFGEFAIQKIYPNPTFDDLTIEFSVPDLESFTVQIFNSIGQLVFQKQERLRANNDGKIILDVKHLSAGTYFLRFKNKSQNLVEPFVKMR